MLCIATYTFMAGLSLMSLLLLSFKYHLFAVLDDYSFDLGRIYFSSVQAIDVPNGLEYSSFNAFYWCLVTDEMLVTA